MEQQGPSLNQRTLRGDSQPCCDFEVPILVFEPKRASDMIYEALQMYVE
jgi:hypothetical protein